jgi:hypothetical protein
MVSIARYQQRDVCDVAALKQAVTTSVIGRKEQALVRLDCTCLCTSTGQALQIAAGYGRHDL